MKRFRFLTAVLIFLLAPSLALADYYVTYTGSGTIAPIRNGQNVTWSTNDTKIVSDEVIGYYNTHSSVFTVVDVNVTGAEMTAIDGLGLGSVNTGVTAYATGGQTNATALVTGFNNVTTCATAGDSVKLPAAAAGDVVWVKNSGATDLDIFPASADSIDALAVNLAVTIEPGSLARFVAITAVIWESNVDNTLTLNAPTTAKGEVVLKATDNTGDYKVTFTNDAHGQATVHHFGDPGAAASYVVESTAQITKAEADVLDGPVAGTVSASKAVVVDASSDITGFRHITATGTVTAEQLTTTDDATVQGSATVAEDITVSEDATGGNAGARSQIQGLPKVDMVALGTMTNGTTETTAYIDATPTGEWAEVDAGTNVLITADTTYYRDVTNSVKIALATTAVAGDGVDGTIAADDLTNNESIGVWLYTDATTAVEAGDFAVTLDDDDAAPDYVINLPALVSGVWTWAELDISSCEGGGTDCNVVDGIKVLLTTQGAIKYGVSTGEAINLYIDAMYKWDSSDEETVSHNLVQDGVLSCMTIATAAGTANTPARLTEWTDYLIHYQSGNDAIVTITDQSAASGMCLVAYQ